jgi:hypothetical protein
MRASIVEWSRPTTHVQTYPSSDPCLRHHINHNATKTLKAHHGPVGRWRKRGKQVGLYPAVSLHRGQCWRHRGAHDHRARSDSARRQRQVVCQGEEGGGAVGRERRLAHDGGQEGAQQGVRRVYGLGLIGWGCG